MARIAENLERVRGLIAEAASRSGRDPAGIELIAVSKGRSPELIVEAMRAGQRIFGENRAQELRDKLLEVTGDLEWHFVGHLQTNKVNMVVGKAKLIHSLDSERLAEAMNTRAIALGIRQDVLLQLNISGEDTKYGADEEEASRMIEMILASPGLNLRGLMTIAPLVSRMEATRPYFRRLRELRDGLSAKSPEADLRYLSMGMSQDYHIAVEEGANMVRIGTAIFSN